MVRKKTKVARRMQLLGYSGKELSELLGLSQQQVSTIKNKGFHVSRSCRKCAKVLRCSPLELLEDAGK